MPFISICIPAYKRTEFLKRLLDSIAIQTFRDFEVIVTDDSMDHGVHELIKAFSETLPLKYFKNNIPLGTPENWNESIRHASGEWLKLMHDDDWFADKNSLQSFVNAIKENPGVPFLFSAYANHYLERDLSKDVFVSSYRYARLTKDTATLFSQNIIGPPSVVMVANDKPLFYDNRLKWFVDIDYYIRHLEESRIVYIHSVLVNVGIGKEQVTQDCFRQRLIEVPEAFHLFNKIGFKRLKNILVYDAWWRLIRNLEIRSLNDIAESGYNGEISKPLKSMIAWQKKIPPFLIKNGVFSKMAMFLNYLFNYNRIAG
jgi:glycosyltransferase involved in cell wall biosynthesis